MLVPRRRSHPHDPATAADRGSALVAALLVAVLLAVLGAGILGLAQVEATASRAHSERARCDQAALGVLELASGWLELEEPTSARVPPASDWRLDARRGDADGDGASDAACDGRLEEGRLDGWRRAGRAHPFGETFDPAALCGDREHPDLLIDSGDWLDALGATLGDGLEVERIALFAGPDRGGALATIACTVASKGPAGVKARVSGTAELAAAPSLAGPEVLAAGGDVVIERGAAVRWGEIRAGGDAWLPRPGERGFPVSGLPRRTGGREPVDFAPGGVMDWDLTTRTREYVLTELMGTTRGGERQDPLEAEPPPLPDPWVSVQAGGKLLLGGSESWAGGSRATQPRPHDPSRALEDDLSHLVRDAGRAEALLSGRLRATAVAGTGRPASGRRFHRFFLEADQRAGDGEPRWSENGRGAARTASEWLEVLGEGGATLAFLAPGGSPPRRVTLDVVAGSDATILVEAGELVARPKGSPRLEAVNMPGEPFLDVGIDADGDGVIDPGTAGNGRWDVDADGDGRADAPGEDLAFPADVIFRDVHRRAASGRVPDHDRSPSFLKVAPHEPFLGLRWPAIDRRDSGDVSVRVDFGAEADGAARPVADLDGDGRMVNGVDRFTGLARDEVGARVLRAVHLRGMVANLTGDLRLVAGLRLHGAVRAEGSVVLELGTELTFDDAWRRLGRPSGTGRGVVVRSTALRRLGLGERRAGGEPALPEPAAPSGPTPLPRGSSGGGRS